MVCVSAAMRAVMHLAQRLAEGDAKILISGESGVGKDLIARFIHASSRRAGGPFVAVNCGAFTDTLLETELFGHVRGSFTGADRDHAGKLASADGGTIFLDEVSEMSPRMQVVLLRFLESGEIQTVGAAGPGTRLDVRVVTATNRNLQDMVHSGMFREDLLYRLRVGHIVVPPLRERRDDILPLVDSTVTRTGRAVKFSDEARHVLANYRWPGNVRELQNVVEQVVWMADHSDDQSDVQRDGERRRVIAAQDLPIRGDAAIVPTPERRRQLADELYAGLSSNSFSFWGEIYELFLSRDITRHDIRELVRRGLVTTQGRYRALVPHFGMAHDDYKRFMNFLTAHGCNVDPRPFRTGRPAPSTRRTLPIASLLDRRNSPASRRRA